MATTAFPNLVDAIVTALRSAASLTGVTIYDGIEIDSSDPTNWISIGHDGTEDGEVIAATVRNEYKALGAKSMFENGSINCTLVSWTGDTNLSTCRIGAYALLDAVDTVIRTDPSFGGVVLYSGLDNNSPSYLQTQAGSGVQINFTITYRAKT
jgi:hypothetical protein